MKRYRIFLLFSFLFLTAPFAYGKQDCNKALDAIPPFDAAKKMFPEIHAFYKKYDSCMDAGIAEGMAAVITESLDKSWGQLGDLHRILKREPQFKKFILDNISPSVTAQEADVHRIMEHAKKQCPKGLSGLCREIFKACKSALTAE